MRSNDKDNPSSEYKKFINISQDFFEKYIFEGCTIGLGSGSTVEKVIRNLDLLDYKKSLQFVVTSLQIRLVADSMGLKIIEPDRTKKIDVVLDGADQIDSSFVMIKGGGGALLREKILIASSQKFVIFAQSGKFVDKLSMPVPIEVTPFGRNFVLEKLEKMGCLPNLRLLDKGYPFISENGNIIYDTLLPSYDNLKILETDLKNIPGVIEVGLFTNLADTYYKIRNESEFEKLSPRSS
jgi:ribose 5-phosphate isomerase A